MSDDGVRWFRAGVSRYRVPSHWRGVGFSLQGVDYRLCPVVLGDIERAREFTDRGELKLIGYPSMWAPDGDEIEVFPTPHVDLEMIQVAERLTYA